MQPREDNKLNLRPTPPPPLTSRYTPKKVQQQVKGVTQKKKTPLLFVQSKLRPVHHLCIRLVEVAASSAVKVSGGRFRKGGPPPPLKKQQNLEREKPGRRLLPEPSGSRKRAPVSSGFTTTGPSTNHLDRRILPDYTEKGLAEKKNRPLQRETTWNSTKKKLFISSC